MTWLWTEPLSGAQILGLIVGLLWLVGVFYLVCAWLAASTATLVVVKNDPPATVTFPPDTPSSYTRDLAPEPTDGLFDSSPAAIARHPRRASDPREDLPFYAYHALVSMRFGYATAAYECAVQAAHAAFQLRPDLKAPLIEHQRVPVIPFPRPVPQKRVVVH